MFRKHLLIMLILIIPITHITGSPISTEGAEGSSVDIIIGKNETVVHRNTTLMVNGTVSIEGRLIIDNTTMVVGSETVFLNNGTLEISGNSVLNSSSPTLILSTSTGVLNISNSSLYNFRVRGGDKEVSNSLFENSGLLIEGDHLSDSTFLNGSEIIDTAIEVSSGSKTVLKNITIDNYPVGIRLTSGGLELRDSSIISCWTGLESSSSTQISIMGSRIESFDQNIATVSPLYLVSAIIQGGKTELSGSAMIATRSTFYSTQEISGIDTGIFRNCSFIECIVGLTEPRGITVTNCRFELCDIAMESPVESLIYHNSFVSNGDVVVGVPNSNWFNSDLGEGNYYSGYGGSDDGSSGRRANDGIGDTNIPYLGRDEYPLMKDGLWEMPRIVDLMLEYQKGSSTVNLSWADHGGDGVIVQRSPSPGFEVGMISWSVTGRNISIDNNPNSTLYFRAGVFNDVGYRGWSAHKQVTVDQKPLPPSGVNSEPLDQGSALRVEWENRGEDIVRTYVFHSPVGGKVSYKAVDYPQEETLIEGLENDRSYNISLVTEDAAGQVSSPSDNITDSPKDIIPPPPPRTLRGEAVSNTTIELFWDPPLIQDISNYLLFRRTEGEDFVLIANLSRLVYSYRDEGLEDNRTYVYAMRSLDDDGPQSELSEVLVIDTLHYNRNPLFSGRFQYVPMNEDQGPLYIEIEELVSDPDGDDIQVVIQEYYRVKAELLDDRIWIIPSPDQAGSGFVKVLASDGESSTFFIIGIMIQELPDPPADVRILSPLNGSVHIPGERILLHAEADDPDIPYGDNLTYRWSSDLDGPLTGNGTLSGEVRRELSPGIHNITLKVTDNNGSMMERSVTMIVSYWGWEMTPWSASLVSLSATDSGGEATLKVENGSPVSLMFIASPSDLMTGTLSGERRINLAPSTTGLIELRLTSPMKAGSRIDLNWTVRAETMNGTFAGERKVGGSTTVRSSEKEDGSRTLVVVLMAVSALITVMGVIGVIILGMGNSPSSDQNIENGVGNDRTGSGVKNGR